MGAIAQNDDEPASTFLPGYRNYLVYCDDSGLNGTTHYAFGSLWMPSERRGTFVDLIRSLRNRHRMQDEFKWKKINRRYEAFYCDLVETFFRRPWLMFHCLLVERAVIHKEFHNGDYDLARRKHFAMLLKAKIRDLCLTTNGKTKRYHVRVDPLPSRYPKADEAALRIVNSQLKQAIGHPAVATLLTRDSKKTPGIALADVLLGAVMDDWCGASTITPKKNVKDTVAHHLGWADLAADTYSSEWKFNIWLFYDPKSGDKRSSNTRSVSLKYPMRLVERASQPRDRP
jgi:hypothetical protein